MPFEIPTREEIQAIFRDELSTFFGPHLQKMTAIDRKPFDEADDVGGVEMASAITGKEISTIYTMCSKRQIPHAKRGGVLYFSKRELLQWIADGRRKTSNELREAAERV